MEEQNFKNHTGLSFWFHGVVLGMILLAIVASCVKLYRNWDTGLGGLLMPVIALIISISLLFVAFSARGFALRAQDRAIRAEENLRYYAITGDLMDMKLTISQVVALRFAPNNELVDLAHRAVNENMSNKEIKMAIKNWRGDYHRV